MKCLVVVTIGSILFLSCSQSSNLQEDYTILRTENQQLRQQILFLEKEYGELDDSNRKLQQEIGQLTTQIESITENSEPVDPSLIGSNAVGLYEILRPDPNSNSYTVHDAFNTIQIIPLGVGYKIQGLNRNGVWLGEFSRPSSTYLPSLNERKLVFSWQVGTDGFGEFGTDILTYEVDFSNENLSGIRYINGKEDSSEAIKLIKKNDDPYWNPNGYGEFDSQM